MLPNLSVHLVKIAFFTLLISVFSGCDSGQDSDANGNIEPIVGFEHDGLSDHVVSHLYQHDARYFAATNQGLYTKLIGEQWQSAGLAQMQVQVHDVAIITDNHYIASVRETIDGVPNDRLVETVDGGVTWQTIEHNFGGESPKTVYALAYDEFSNALYATGVQALAASYDDGRSWQLLNGMWDAFGQPMHEVEYNPLTNEIWYGGQNAIEQMVLVRYSLNTGEAQRFSDLLPSPSVIYDIEFHPTEDNTVYVSGEGGVLKTETNGDSWTTLIGEVDHRFYFDLELDPLSPEILYTGGWDKGVEGPQPLILEISTDGGNTWTQHRPASDTPFGGVRSVLTTVEAGVAVVYLGLQGGGVMRAVMI